MIKKWIGAVALLVLFALLALTMRKDGPTRFDEVAGDWIRSWRGDGLTAFFKAMSPLVSTTAFIIVLVVFALFFILMYRKWLEPLLLLINLAIAFGLYKGLKELFERPRPSVEALIEASGYGFPSGNALLSSAVYGFAAYALYRLWSKRHPMRSRTAAAIGILLVLAIGVSRVYLGVHYPSDIIAGYCLGTALLLVTGERIGKR